MSLKTKIPGFDLKNPIIPASGTYGFGYEYFEIKKSDENVAFLNDEYICFTFILKSLVPYPYLRSHHRDIDFA